MTVRLNENQIPRGRVASYVWGPDAGSGYGEKPCGIGEVKALAEALAEKRPDIKVTGSTSNVYEVNGHGVADSEKETNGEYKWVNEKPVPGKFETYQNGKLQKTAPQT